MNKKDIALIIMGIVILVLLGLYGYNYIFQQGRNIGQLEIISEIQQTGNIPVVNVQGNQTSINWMNINDICGG